MYYRPSRDVFGCHIDSDAILQALQNNEMPVYIKGYFLMSVVEVSICMSYLSHLSLSMMTQAKSALVHNMF